MSILPSGRPARPFAARLQVLLAIVLVLPAAGRAALPADVPDQIAKIARDTLAATGVPSASIAIVYGDQIAYTRAFGDADVAPRREATPAMRYSIGSVSKQFTAAAILLLCEEGKLSLDDPVSRFLPNLTRANEVTVRQLLTHTSGYQDYWPQDYVPSNMLRPATSSQILDRWARIPLDFEPGTQWQYSNTNYVAAGLIVEQVSGQPLIAFLQQRIFSPLGMKSVLNIDRNRLTQADATGYQRFALGPLRVAPKEGPGWLYAAAELAMTAEDLAHWDLSLLQQKLLQPRSYREMTREQLLRNGASSGYGLGLFLGPVSGHRAWSHGGEVSGFVSDNIVLPDDHAAVVVLTNEDNSSAAATIAEKIAPLLFAPSPTASPAIQARDRSIFEKLQHGAIDPALFTENGRDYFTPEALADFATGLKPLGQPTEFNLVRQSIRGGMTTRVYDIKFTRKTLRLVLREMPDGKIEQYQISAED